MNHYLKGLSASEQVGAMFLIVFGFLALCSAVTVLLSIRDRPDGAVGDARHQVLVRADVILRSSWLMVIVFWIGWLSGETVATVLFGLVSFFALREFLTLSPTRRG